MGFGILGRRDSGNEKCPRCSRVNVDFMDLGFGMLGCFECGTVFVSKAARAEVRKTRQEYKDQVAKAPVAGYGDRLGELNAQIAAIYADGIPVTPLEIEIPGKDHGEGMPGGVLMNGPEMEDIKKSGIPFSALEHAVGFLAEKMVEAGVEEVNFIPIEKAKIPVKRKRRKARRVLKSHK